jgi:hypothetical protein
LKREGFGSSGNSFLKVWINTRYRSDRQADLYQDHIHHLRKRGISMVNKEALQIGKALVLVGGVLIIVLGLVQWIGATAFWSFSMYMPRLYRIESGFMAGIGLVVDLIAGVVAIIGSKKADELVWAIILLIVGIVVGGWGGVLVVVGAIVALVSRYI